MHLHSLRNRQTAPRPDLGEFIGREDANSRPGSPSKVDRGPRVQSNYTQSGVGREVQLDQPQSEAYLNECLSLLFNDSYWISEDIVEPLEKCQWKYKSISWHRMA